MTGALGLVAGLWLAGQWLGDGGASALGVVPQGGSLGGAVIAGTARVVDGDTLRIGSTRIRIQGIDAPETDDVCRRPDGSRWDCGVWSTRVARELVAGQRVVCEDMGERSHDRVVARCLVGDRDFSEAMLRAGAARACERYALQHSHSLGYMALEEAAARARVGIFDGTPPGRAGFCEPRPGQVRPGQVRAEAVAEVRVASGSCDIKGNINAAGERIYHLPGQAHYDRVVIRPELGQRWFCSSEEAVAAGWRRALR